MMFRCYHNLSKDELFGDGSLLRLIAFNSPCAVFSISLIVSAAPIKRTDPGHDGHHLSSPLKIVSPLLI